MSTNTVDGAADEGSRTSTNLASTLSRPLPSGTPLLDQYREGSPYESQVRRSIRTSPARLGSLLMFAVVGGAVVVGCAASTLIAHSIGWLLSLTCGASALLVLAGRGRFRTRMVPDLAGQFARVGSSVLVGSAVPFALLAVIDSNRTNFRAFSGLVVVLVVSAVVGDLLAAVFVRRVWASGRYRSRAVLVGSGRLAAELEIELNLRPEYGVDIVGVVDPSEGDLAQRLLRELATCAGDRVIFSPDDRTPEAPLADAAREAIGLGIPTFLIPRFHGLGVGLDSMAPDRARGYPMIRVQRASHPSISRKVKRLLDVLVSGFALFLLWPVLAVTALLVRVTSPGPILFRQSRVGQRGHAFDMLKFRSMTASTNDNAERSSAHRVTTVGKFIRASSIDELPQLVNILRGEMSLVGPRPERVAFVEEGMRLYEGYDWRHRAPMGLTGLAQVAGLRGEETSVQERVKFDNLYIDQWSLALDLQILAKTVFGILMQSRYRSREVQMSKALQEAGFLAERDAA